MTFCANHSAVNFIDGKRTVGEIEQALIGEFGRQAFKGVDRYIEDLVKVGAVRWKQANVVSSIKDICYEI